MHSQALLRPRMKMLEIHRRIIGFGRIIENIECKFWGEIQHEKKKKQIVTHLYETSMNGIA